MNTPSPEDNGFPAKLRGNPHASRPKAGSRPLDKMQHVVGRVDVAAVDATAAVAAVHPFAKRLRPVGIAPASAASPGGAARVDQDHRPVGAFSLAGHDVDPAVRARVLLAGDRQRRDPELQRHEPLPVRAADDRVHRLRRQLAVPPDPGEARDADEPQPPVPADQPVADAEVGAAEARKARSPARLQSPEETLERPVAPAQDLLPGAAAVAGQFRDRVPDGLQLVRLVRVAKAGALPPSGLDALLEARVAEAADVSRHVREGRFLRPVRAGPALAAHDHPPSRVRHAFLPGQAGRHCKGRACPCRLNATVPCASSYGT